MTDGLVTEDVDQDASWWGGVGELRSLC